MTFLHTYHVSPGKWIIYWIIMFQILPEIQSICITKDTFYCQNRRQSFIVCKLQEGVKIKSAVIARPNPFLHCKYNRGKYSSERHVPQGYGYFGNVLWITKSCRLKYKVCYSGETVSKGTSIMKQRSSFLASLPSTGASNTDENSLKNISDWSHTEEAHKLKTSNALIVAITVTLTLIGGGLAVLGLYFRRKRANRHRNSKELSSRTENSYGLLQIAQRVKDNSYFTLEPQKECSTVQHDRLGLQMPKSKQQNLQQGRAQVTEETIYNCVTDSNDTYCSIDEVADTIQSLPDSEYNVLNTKPKYICHDPTYHLLQNMPIGKEYFSADDVAYNSTANMKVMNTVVDYSHIS